MAFRFQKRVKIAPGLRVNLSKSGVSASLGKPGATVNVNKHGVQGTAGAPGTGLSYTKTSKARKEAEQQGRSSWGFLGIVAAISSILVLISPRNRRR